LNLIDLAGSEKLSEDGVISETSNINRSLLVLSNVINKLSEQKKGSQAHIPFRESKLTQVLRSALGGNSLTSIICTVSPNLDHVSQSLSTIRFAQRAKCIQTKAVANEVVDDFLMI